MVCCLLLGCAVHVEPAGLGGVRLISKDDSKGGPDLELQSKPEKPYAFKVRGNGSDGRNGQGEQSARMTKKACES